MKSQCYVTAEDYNRFWAGIPPADVPVAVPYDGPERRTNNSRRAWHDRRWNAAVGRRFRLVDRRRRTK